MSFGSLPAFENLGPLLARLHPTAKSSPVKTAAELRAIFDELISQFQPADLLSTEHWSEVHWKILFELYNFMLCVVLGLNYFGSLRTVYLNCTPQVHNALVFLLSIPDPTLTNSALRVFHILEYYVACYIAPAVLHICDLKYFPDMFS